MLPYNTGEFPMVGDVVVRIIGCQNGVWRYGDQNFTVEDVTTREILLDGPGWWAPSFFNLVRRAEAATESDNKAATETGFVTEKTVLSTTLYRYPVAYLRKVLGLPPEAKMEITDDEIIFVTTSIEKSSKPFDQ